MSMRNHFPKCAGRHNIRLLGGNTSGTYYYRVYHVNIPIHVLIWLITGCLCSIFRGLSHVIRVLFLFLAMPPLLFRCFWGSQPSFYHVPSGPPSGKFLRLSSLYFFLDCHTDYYKIFDFDNRCIHIQSWTRVYKVTNKQVEITFVHDCTYVCVRAWVWIVYDRKNWKKKRNNFPI